MRTLKSKKGVSDLKACLAIAGLCVTLGLGGFGIKKYSDYQKKPFKQTTHLAQKIANEVVLHTEGDDEMGLSKWVEDQGYKDFKMKRHTHKFTSRNNIYIIEVDILEDGTKDMKVDYYMTNQNFDELKTAKDFIIHELQYGKPGIYIERHFSDDSIDGKLEKKWMYIREEENCELRAFTKKERDRKGSDVKCYTVDNGQVFKEGKWVDSPEDKKSTQEDYEMLLEDISKKIRDTWDSKPVLDYVTPL